MSESVIDQEVAGDSAAAVQKPRPHPTATTVDNPSRVLLDVRNLSIGYDGTEVVHGVDFSIDKGESLALVGQSGSGKSTIAGALLRLGAGEITDASASIELAGESVIRLSARRFRRLLRSDIAYIPQFPLSSLNPTRTVRFQLRESLRAAGVPRAESGREALEESLLSVGILEPARVLDSFPHQLSGGQLQRVLIAMAIAKSPKLIIADEPTSALDISLRRSILDLIRAKQEELGSSVLLITHDLSVARALTHTALILNHGRVVEAGPSDRILEHPESEYGRMLLASIPEKNVHRYDEARVERRARVASAPPSASALTPPIVSVQNVSKTFGGTRALVDASIAVEKGTTFALVGESGSGKTTLARAVLGLVEPDEGTITVDGTPVDATDVGALRTVRRHLQFVYQDGTSSLDPRYSALRAVAEPLQRFGIIQDRGERLAEATRLLTAVGLPREIHGAKPRQLSGGQRQRVAIARAIALRPDVVVLDEPTSALDVSVQAQIVDLLIDLQSRFDLTYILVSHDLGLVRQFADTVAVLRGGRILETGPVEQIFERPSDPFTVTLIENSLL